MAADSQNEEARELERREMDWLIICLRELHPHQCLMIQSEKDLVNKMIHRFKIHGEKTMVANTELSLLHALAEKLRIGVCYNPAVIEFHEILR